MDVGQSQRDSQSLSSSSSNRFYFSCKTSDSEYFMTILRREFSVRIWTAVMRHRLNRLAYAGVPHDLVARMRDENQQAFGRGGRVRGRAAPLLAGARLIPVGHVRPDDLMGYVAYQQPPVRG